jgi:hypothetical protein
MIRAEPGIIACERTESWCQFNGSKSTSDILDIVRGTTGLVRLLVLKIIFSELFKPVNPRISYSVPAHAAKPRLVVVFPPKPVFTGCWLVFIGTVFGALFQLVNAVCAIKEYG